MGAVVDLRTATNHFPGIRRYIVGLVGAFSGMEKGMDISILGPESGEGSDKASRSLQSIPCSVSPFSLRQQWVIPGILGDSGATLYHSPYYLMPYLPGIPTVLTCHDVIPLIYPAYFTLWQRLVYRATNKMALKTASAVIAVSESTRQDVIRLFHANPARITTIHSAVEETFTPQPPDLVSRVLKKYAIPEKYILYVGINKPHKNLVSLVEAWRILLTELHGTGCTLVVAGFWDDRYPEAKRLAAKSGLGREVLFTGPVGERDLPALYSGATLFVFPSLYEGFGFPVLEAMACGTPVACSRTSSLREVAGDAAYLFDPRDPWEMARQIADLLSHGERLRDLREAGLYRASQFVWDGTAAETLKVYRKALL
jgi:glycosyltransferase involved in cell wall biosynthesis